MLKYVWTKFEILPPYISWDTVHFVEILTIYPPSLYNFFWISVFLLFSPPLKENCFCSSMASLWVIYSWKNKFWDTYPKQFFDAFMMIWQWKSGFSSWNQNFRKRTLFVWSCTCSNIQDSSMWNIDTSTINFKNLTTRCGQFLLTRLHAITQQSDWLKSCNLSSYYPMIITWVTHEYLPKIMRLQS